MAKIFPFLQTFCNFFHPSNGFLQGSLDLLQACLFHADTNFNFIYGIFDMAYPKQDLMKGKTNFKVEQLTTKIKTIVKNTSITTKCGCSLVVLVH